MKTSCISHPANEPLVIIRKWQVVACDGNHCAAALLAFFEHGHNFKLAHQQQAIRANEVAVLHKDPATQDESLYQWQTEQDLQDGMLGLYGETKIGSSIKLLADKGFVSIHRNPNTRYVFDRTRFFLFHPDVVQKWLDDYEASSVTSDASRYRNSDASSVVSDARSVVNDARSVKNDGSIHLSEITPQPTPVLTVSEPSKPASPLSRARPKTLVPDTFDVTDNLWEWANEAGWHGSRISLVQATDQFLDHWRAKGELKADWVAAWRTWIRNDIKWARDKDRAVKPVYSNGSSGTGSGIGNNGRQRESVAEHNARARAHYEALWAQEEEEEEEEGVDL